MKNNWKWIVSVALVLALLFALPFLFRTFLGYGYRGWSHPMMGYGFAPFGGLFMGFGMLLMWAIPLGLLFLITYGAVKLANKPNTPVVAQSCGNCGKAVQADWKNCPYCGTEL